MYKEVVSGTFQLNQFTRDITSYVPGQTDNILALWDILQKMLIGFRLIHSFIQHNNLL